MYTGIENACAPLRDAQCSNADGKKAASDYPGNDAMRSAAHRLRKDKDFDRIWRTGREAQAGGLRIRWARGLPKTVRTAIIVSKKVHKLATRRNRLRRVIREGLRPLLPRLYPGGDYLFVATVRLAGASSHDIRGMIDQICTRNKLYID